MVPQPVLAVLLLFPVTDKSEAARKAGKQAAASFCLPCYIHVKGAMLI